MSGVGALIFIVFVVAMIFFIPRQIRAARKKVGQGGQRISELTGLQQQGKEWTGTYEGFPARISNDIAFDWGSLVMKGLGQDALSPFFQMRVTLELPGGPFPSLDIIEYASFFWHTNMKVAEFLQGRGSHPDELKVDTGGISRGVTVYGSDQGFAAHVLGDPTVQATLGKWKHIDVRVKDGKVELSVMEKAVRMWHLFGKDYTDSTIYKSALEICAAVARACQFAPK